VICTKCHKPIEEEPKYQVGSMKWTHDECLYQAFLSGAFRAFGDELDPQMIQDFRRRQYLEKVEKLDPIGHRAGLYRQCPNCLGVARANDLEIELSDSRGCDESIFATALPSPKRITFSCISKELMGLGPGDLGCHHEWSEPIVINRFVFKNLQGSCHRVAIEGDSLIIHSMEPQA
jgi:hypothetical protein